MTDNIQKEIEDKVIDCINSGVAGRLIIFKPEAAPFGADLAVERRGKYKENLMYFQVNILVGPSDDNNFTKDFLQESFKTDKNFYLLFVYFDEVKQKISDYIWLVPSLKFRDIADVVKSPDGKNSLRFQSSLDTKNKNQYSKYIIDTKEFGKLILEAFEKKGKFEFKETGFQENKAINLDSLKEFLCEARRNTYASNATPIDNARLLSSTQLEFQKGEHFYRDVYFSGTKKFIGQEVVYQGLKPIWGMSYMGDIMEKLETSFLKESLFRLSNECRLGKTCEYEKREYKYQDQGQGSLGDFFGRELIFVKGKNIYKLNYQGGLISWNL